MRKLALAERLQLEEGQCICLDDPQNFKSDYLENLKTL
jgi:hypothetical protein